MSKLYSFRETKAFTKEVLSLLSDDGYFAFQNYLLENYLLGDVIPGGGGLRKIRCASKTKEKAAEFALFIMSRQKKVIFI